MNEQNQETEVKFYVRNLAEIGRRLQPPLPFGHLPQIRNKALHQLLLYYSRIWGRPGGGLIQPRMHEVNLRFDTPAGDFRREGRVLRLRQDAAARLTYKDGSRSQGRVVSRREIEFDVGNFDSARRLLEALGYEVVFLYEKYRTTFETKDAQVMLDETPLGGFVEIEGDLAELRPTAIQLGLNWEAAVAASYHALFERVRKARGLTFRDLSFENFKGISVSSEDLGVEPADP